MLQGVQGEDPTGFINTGIADRSSGAPVPSVNNLYFLNYEKLTQRNVDRSSFVSDIFVNSLTTFNIREAINVTGVALAAKGSGLNTVCVTNNVYDTAGYAKVKNLGLLVLEPKSSPILCCLPKIR